MKIAVIGAGIAGLACARRLGDGGHEVTTFEAGDVPGGRVGTLRTEIGGFDHGAQYLTARDAAFVAQVDAWSAAGIVEPWAVEAHSIEAIADRKPTHHPSTGRTLRWIGVPGMAAIPARMAEGLDVRYDARVVALDEIRSARETKPRWGLQRRGSDDPDASVTEGLYDAVVVAVPAEAASLLLAASPTLARQTAVARIEPCWALLVGFAEPIAADLARVGDAAFVNSGRLAWIARESSKPERRIGERWTIHAQSAWSVEHFDDDPEDVKAKLLRAFHDATGTIEQPVYALAYRWRHALARSSLGCEYLWDGDRRVGACGDWCRGYRIEDAWLSGVAMAGAIGGPH
jgi:renalase